ncbi:MAG: hypothetical protein ACXWNZ_01055 [Vulcanimicrobiaceae bacterium]
MNHPSELPAEGSSTWRDVTVSRIGPAVAIIATLTLLSLMPERYRITPAWFPHVAVVLTLGPMTMVFLTRGNLFWRRVERYAIAFAALLATSANVLNVLYVLKILLFTPEELRGTPLLAASVSIWVSNVIVFALLYWLTDRGGPEERSAGELKRGDFLFPEQTDEKAAPAGWRPTFVDYLYLAFTGATGFGVTHTVPVTRRGKLLLMIEAQIALVSIVVVGARAVGILQ